MSTFTSELVECAYLDPAFEGLLDASISYLDDNTVSWPEQGLTNEQKKDVQRQRHEQFYTNPLTNTTYLSFKNIEDGTTVAIITGFRGTGANSHIFYAVNGLTGPNAAGSRSHAYNPAAMASIKNLLDQLGITEMIGRMPTNSRHRTRLTRNSNFTDSEYQTVPNDPRGVIEFEYTKSIPPVE